LALTFKINKLNEQNEKQLKEINQKLFLQDKKIKSLTKSIINVKRKNIED
jgi:hypothetical protein